LAAATGYGEELLERANVHDASNFGPDDSLAEDPDLILSLDELLTRLDKEDATAAWVAHLHLFGGLSVEEAAKAVGVSRAVAYRNWKYARAWLRDALEK
jgi:hypothetical protein